MLIFPYIALLQRQETVCEKPKLKVRHFAGNIFKCIFLNGNDCIFEFVIRGEIDYMSTLGDKLSWYVQSIL